MDLIKKVLGKIFPLNNKDNPNNNKESNIEK